MRIHALLFIALGALGCDDASTGIATADVSPTADATLGGADATAEPDAAPLLDGDPPPDAQPDLAPEPDAGPIPLLPARMGIGGLGPPGNVAAMAERGGIEWSLLRPYRTPDGDIDVDRLLDTVDCLVLPGGDDIDPALYGEQPHPTVRLISEARAEFDFAVLRAALDRGMPVLGLCLGGQALTVALGGSLVQDIPSEVPDHLNHRALHDIEIVDGTLMTELYGVSTLNIFSNHHQAADEADLGEGLRVAARSADGVVEAFEAIDRNRYPFVFGTQYHPERQLESGAHDGLIEGFRAACLDYQAHNPRPPTPVDHGEDWQYGACQSDVGPGVCVDVSVCGDRGGTASPGFCPGPAEIQCCAGLRCLDGSGQGGECFATDLCDQLGGERLPFLCPGDDSVQCCLEG